MENKSNFRYYLLPTIVLCLGGWGGLLLLITFTLPTLWPRWGFYALVILAVTGTTIPFSYLFNKLMSETKIVNSEIITRESVGIGVYFAVLSWLSIGKVLNFPIAIWLALGLLFIEYLIRLREPMVNKDNVSSQPPIS
ncbi:MAG: hypothetical protein WCP19_04755 [Chloroflexota bacterium]